MAIEHHVIIGAGHAGATAAIELRRAGFTGTISLIGDEPHLPYERPPLSKQMLLAGDAEPAWIHTQAQLDEAAITPLLGRRAVAIDPAAHIVDLDDGTRITFDKLLLAPGGLARTPSVPGGDQAHVLRSLDDARRLQQSLKPGSAVVVIGAGVIGLEVASSASALGAQVTVIEQAPGPMARSLHPEIQAYVDGLHRRNGVTLRYGETLDSIEVRGEGDLLVHLAGSDPLPAALVVAGIGLAPDLTLAKAAGLATSSGILVDEYGATSAEDIFAAGDAACFWHPDLGAHVHWQTWQHAQNHGKAIARLMAGGERLPYRPNHWFWSDQHGVNMQFTGITNSGDEIVYRGDPAADRFAAFHRADGAIIGASFINSGGMVRPTQALITAGTRVPAEQLADPAIPLNKLGR